MNWVSGRPAAELDVPFDVTGVSLGSIFAWLDYAERDRKRSLDLIDLFAEHDTRDELGLGVIRDAFSDLLFPGTTTLQTRARYFLFVPWMYLDFERREVSSARVDRERVLYEDRLIETLIRCGSADGAIGRVARSRLQRKASSIYWLGLGSWGIRLLDASQTQYQLSLDSYYRRRRGTRASDDGEGNDPRPRNWHAGLPTPPAGFPDEMTLELSPVEGEYLAERLALRARGSLLAFLAVHGRSWSSTEYAWIHPQLADFPTEIRRQLEHARLFSTVMHGAALLYNLLLAELRVSDELVAHYRGRLEEWAARLEQMRSDVAAWDLLAFWSLVMGAGARVHPYSRSFVESWVGLVRAVDNALLLADRDDARRLIGERERQLKRTQARLGNPRALELWGGGSGTAALDFRWGVSQRILLDIVTAREKTSDA